GEEGSEAFILARGVLKAVRETDGAEQLLAVLGAGAIVGEMALVSDAPRAASVVAVEPSEILVVGRAALERLAGQDPTVGKELAEFCRARMLSNLLRHSEILSAVPSADRESLMERFAPRTFEPGECLLRHGAEGDGLYLVASGLVEVQGRDADDDAVVVAQLGPGDVVGEMSLVLRRHATADVIAVYPTVALELGRAAFQQTIREYPELLSQLYDVASRRDEELRSVVAQEALDVEDVVLL